MSKTNYFEFVYPDEGERPYYEKISNFFNEIDRAIYSRQEDWNYVLIGGGTINFNSANGELSWSEPIFLINLETGYKYVVNSGSIIVNDGEIVYLQIVRNLSEDKVINFSKTNTLFSRKSDYDSIYIIGLRVLNKFFIRPVWQAL